MLEITDLNVGYDGSQILRNVSFKVPANQVVCLMGRNGVGKTTTLKSIVGLLNPMSGSVRLDGMPLDGKPPEARARAGIGYVPQGRDIFPHLTVRENLELSLVIHRQPREQLEKVYELFPVIREMLERKGGVLSGGQQQQLAIARALLTGPKILLLDEPTEGIQPSIIDLIGQTLQRIKAETNISILLVEQCLDFAKSVADSFYIMDRGSIVVGGAIQDLNDQVVRQHLVV